MGMKIITGCLDVKSEYRENGGVKLFLFPDVTTDNTNIASVGDISHFGTQAKFKMDPKPCYSVSIRKFVVGPGKLIPFPVGGAPLPKIPPELEKWQPGKLQIPPYFDISDGVVTEEQDTNGQYRQYIPVSWKCLDGSGILEIPFLIIGEN